MKYIGETKRMLKFNLADHWCYINIQDETQATHQDTVWQTLVLQF